MITILLNFIFLQISILIFINFIAFLAFEIIPILLKKENTIPKNFNDLITYQFGMSIFSILFGAIIFIIFKQLNLVVGLMNISNLSILIQTLIVYLVAEFLIYLSHLGAHKWKIPLVSKSHMFHHKTTTDLQWVNSKKEHPFIIFLFILVFCFVFYTLFQTDNIVKILCVNIFIFLQALSHFRIPVTIKYLDFFFLFPKDHHKHHQQRTGPYGVTLAIFDNIFKTNSK